ncbi:LDLR chaperone boca-like [Actinia tenebrosa]|uniref:LDLR chaperone boca-like n=1 Tax=Actinia tenebrosa TaxID=6105 RepID=A0A6P8IXV3_ACTTE|nr:LDLR chaperone boca-like [Actinia tenebrosa]
MADVLKSWALRFCLVFFIVLFVLVCSSSSEKNKNTKKDKAAKSKEKIGKNILDYTEADMERLLDQWDDNEDDDDEKYDDDDPRKPKPQMPAFDPSKVKDDPMAFVKMAKKGKTLMMFVSIANNPSRKRTEDVTARWQTSLHNAHLQVERYIVADDRALFLLKDGSIAWDVKDFIITQPECKMVEFENQKFPGVGGKPSDTLKEKSEL